MHRHIAVAIALAALTGCGGTTTTVTTTVTRTVTKTEPASAPAPRTQSGKPSLATRPLRAGEVLFVGEGLASAGPKHFRGGIYGARFEQFAPDDPTLNFRTDSSSIVIQLNRKPGVIAADTVTVTNATKRAGKTSVTVPAGDWYADVSADHSWVVRFTPG